MSIFPKRWQGRLIPLYNIPKFMLPIKDKQQSLLSRWCEILLNIGCDKIIIGTSIINKNFIDHLKLTQLADNDEKIIIKIINNSQTMNNTIK